MSNDLSSPLKEDIDALMLKVARDVAQDIYPIEDILLNRGVTGHQFEAFKNHPRFQGYVISEREAWLSAGNIESRTKLKAGVVLETFMDGAYTEMTDKKTALNQRVELGKMLAKIAGFGEPKSFVNTGGGGGPGFMLQINIGPGVKDDGRRETITIQPEIGNLPPDIREHSDMMEVIKTNGFGPVMNISASIQEFSSDIEEDEDDFDPFTSPSTLEDDDQ